MTVLSMRSIWYATPCYAMLLQAALVEAALRAKAAVDQLAGLQADYDNFKWATAHVCTFHLCMLIEQIAQCVVCV